MRSKKEKHELIVKLLKRMEEGVTDREITKMAHCSPNEKTRIRKTNNGENTDTSIEMKSKSICAHLLIIYAIGSTYVLVILPRKKKRIEIQESQWQIDMERNHIPHIMESRFLYRSNIDILGI